MFEIFDQENMPPIDPVWPGESEVVDWAKNPQIDTAPEPSVELSGKEIVVGTLGVVVVGASFGYGAVTALAWVAGSLGVTPKQAECPELPTKARLEAITKDIVSAPTSPKAFDDFIKDKGLALVPDKRYATAREKVASAKSPAKATKAVDAYTFANFGFHTELDKSVKFTEETASDYKRGLLYFVEDSSMVPANLIKNNVAGLYISDKMINDFDKEDRIKQTSSAVFQDDNRTIYSRPLSVWYSFNHELQHALDLKICGGSLDSDSALSAQNPAGFEYDENTDYKRDPKTSYTAYGETDPGEDKAEIFSGFLNWSDATDKEWLSPNQLLQKPQPKLRKTVSAKLVIILERIDRLVPGSARYLSSLSRLRHKEPGPDEISIPGSTDEIFIKGSE